MANVRKYKSRIIKVEQPVSNIFVVTLESLEKRFKFKEGQFLHLALDPFDPSKAWPDSRCFSIQTSPEDQHLKLTYSVKGKFTTRMATELTEGREVCLKLPYGDLFQKAHNKKNCVFIAGGTGITPYLSLFICKDFSEYETPKLYFGVRDMSFHIYQDEFNKSLQINPSLKINIVNQEVEGILDIEKIFAENGVEPHYFISGPPAMINKFKKSLLIKQVNENNIRTDDWG
jgi:predicted ferric reductase